eukprot:jgi/Bigna1/69875/fgenesh1_pg.10_\
MLCKIRARLHCKLYPGATGLNGVTEPFTATDFNNEEEAAYLPVRPLKKNDGAEEVDWSVIAMRAKAMQMLLKNDKLLRCLRLVANRRVDSQVLALTERSETGKEGEEPGSDRPSDPFTASKRRKLNARTRRRKTKPTGASMNSNENRVCAKETSAKTVSRKGAGGGMQQQITSSLLDFAFENCAELLLNTELLGFHEMCMSSKGKRHFDAFRRSKCATLVLPSGETMLTNLAQMRWTLFATQIGLFSFLLKHIDRIRDLFTKHRVAKMKASSGRRGRKKRVLIRMHGSMKGSCEKKERDAYPRSGSSAELARVRKPHRLRVMVQSKLFS